MSGTHTTHLLLPDADVRRVQVRTACGRHVHITYCTRHRIAVTCKACKEAKPQKGVKRWMGRPWRSA